MVIKQNLKNWGTTDRGGYCRMNCDLLGRTADCHIASIDLWHKNNPFGGGKTSSTFYKATPTKSGDSTMHTRAPT